MKKYFLIIIAVFIFLNVYSQQQNEVINKKNNEINNYRIFTKHFFYIDAYYGLNYYAAIWLFSPEVYSVGKGGILPIGPVGVKMEYIAKRRLGFAIDVNYNNNKMYLYGKDYTNTYTLEQFGVLFRTNIYSVIRKRFEYFIGLSLGYKHTYKNFSTTSQYHSYYTNMRPNDIMHLAYKFSFNWRYRFSNNLLGNLEVAFSNISIVNIGISYNIYNKKDISK